jgi:acyl-CoA thioester hydrolase
MAVFQYQYRVTYADCTVGNHIYYGRYLEILEAARGEFFRQLGCTFLEWQRRDTIFPVVECSLRYKAPARYDDVLAVELWVTLAERARLNFGYRVLNQAGTIILEAATLHVCTGVDEKPKRVPEELKSSLGPYVKGG